MLEHLEQNPRAAIFAKMGAGKTLGTALALRDVDLMSDDPVLVLAPKRVANKTWPDELRKHAEFSHLGITPIIGTETERLTALKKDTKFYTINYENVPWLVSQLGSRSGASARSWPTRARS